MPGDHRGRVVDELLGRCTFPPPGTPVICGLSGGADSAALVALAVAAGCDTTAVHVHHHLRPEADDDASAAARIADALGAEHRRVDAPIADGPNLEARARAARIEALGDDAMTGHTADDQAETLLLMLLRGAGATGLAAMTAGLRHPILALRRTETHALCALLDLPVVHDSSNDDPRFRRNRIRHAVLPLLDDVADRDTVPLLARTAALVGADDELLTELAADLDPTDASALAGAPTPLAARAVRAWLLEDGYAPDAASIERVLAVAAGDVTACEVSGGRRIRRSGGRLYLSR